MLWMATDRFLAPPFTVTGGSLTALAASVVGVGVGVPVGFLRVLLSP